MKKLNYGILLLVALWCVFSCSSPQKNRKDKIKSLEKELFSDENKMLDKEKAQTLVTAYISYADEFKKDTETPQYLFKAGDLTMNLNMPQKAIMVFDRILKDFPDFEKAPQCLFLKGYIYENEIHDLNTAKKIYEEFLQKYPDDEFADDAEVSIKNLGKSPEELIKEFENKAKQREEV